MDYSIKDFYKVFPNHSKKYKSEIAFQKYVISLLEWLGIYYCREVLANKTGVPDIICCYNGKFIGIELKGNTNIPSELQLRHIDKIKLSGGIAGVARSLDEVWDMLHY